VASNGLIRQFTLCDAARRLGRDQQKAGLPGV